MGILTALSKAMERHQAQHGCPPAAFIVSIEQANAFLSVLGALSPYKNNSVPRAMGSGTQPSYCGIPLVVPWLNAAVLDESLVELKALNDALVNQE